LHAIGWLKRELGRPQGPLFSGSLSAALWSLWREDSAGEVLREAEL